MKHDLVSAASVAAGLFLLACGAPQTRETQQNQTVVSVVRYDLSFDRSLRQLVVRACFSGPEMPQSLRRLREGAEELLLGARHGAEHLAVRGTEILLGDLQDGDCIEYDVDLLAGRGGWNSIMRGDGELLALPGLFLWMPPQRFAVELEASCPAHHVSLPWTGRRVPANLRGWSGNIAITHAPTDQFEVDGLRIEVARFAGALTVDSTGVREWLGAAVRAVRPIGGLFPDARIHFVLVPAGPGERPVAFGLARRGGGASLLLYPHANATTEALTSDWVAVHELSHLTMPRMTGERWLSEGYATYMQEHLRMRAGLISPEEGFSRILRRIDESRIGAGLPLAEESAQVMQTRTFGHVYWSGAALFLELDVALHRRGSSLAQLMQDVNYNSRRRWTAADCLEALDTTAGQALAMPLVQRYASTTEIPDLGPLFARLGVRLGVDGAEFEDAPDASIRRQISGEAYRSQVAAP